MPEVMRPVENVGEEMGGMTMGEKLILAALLAMFGLCALQDWRRREISVAVVVFFGVLGLGLGIAALERTVWEILLGMLPGGILAALSWGSRGQIGMGDGCLILAAGCYLGFWKILGVFLIASLLTGMAGAVHLLFFGGKRSDRLPFAPFLLAAYVFWLTMA